MTNERVACDRHGEQEIGLACVHVAEAIDTGRSPGFYWVDGDERGCPDAWCQVCEDRLLEQGWSEAWFGQADFKILCAVCWGLAKAQFASGPSRGL
jgi:hypothetical protein